MGNGKIYTLPKELENTNLSIDTLVAFIGGKKISDTEWQAPEIIEIEGEVIEDKVFKNEITKEAVTQITIENKVKL